MFLIMSFRFPIVGNKKKKTLKILVLVIFIIFLRKGCFACALAFWYITSEKNTEKRR